MLIFPEFVSLPFDWNLLLGAGFAAGAAGLASVFTHQHAGGVDLNAVQNRVAELEQSAARTLEQNDELAALYATWATTLFDTDGELHDIVALFGKAEAILQATLAQGDDAEVRQQLANVYLEWAIALNGFDELNEAIAFYQKAVDTLKPLDDAGDGDAKYDTAGIKLNLGIAYRELGDLDKARASLDESFLMYRAVEKISDNDTRFYLATVSVQQGNILHEMGEELDKVTDAYNRAMRLYVEVIEDQQEMTWLERNLANVLLDRCMVTYEDWLDRKFESDAERDQVIDAVLLDISRGVELLEKQYQEGNEVARYDLFHGITLEGKVLCDAGKYAEGKAFLDRAVNEFTDLCDSDDDTFLMQMAMVYATRAVVHLGLGDKNQSELDCQKGSELINKLLQSDSEDEEIQELKQQFQLLLEQLK